MARFTNGLWRGLTRRWVGYVFLVFMAAATPALAQSVLDAGRWLAEQAYQLSRETSGERDPRTLTNLNSLAMLYFIQGRYGEAEPRLKEALQLRREVLGPRHPDTLTSLNNLALLYLHQGRYGEAEPFCQEALQLRREVLGPRHPDTLQSLNNLALLYLNQGRYGEAEPRLEEALRLRREVLGPRHPDTLQSLNNLALLYLNQGRYGEAEPFFKEALQLVREIRGPSHPDTLTSLNNLALLYQNQGRYGEAEPLLKQALQLGRKVFGPHHRGTLTSLHNLALLYLNLGRYGEPEPRLEEALQLAREVLGPRHPDTLQSLNNLALLYERQGRFSKAESLYQETLQLRRNELDPRHPGTLESLNNLASAYTRQGRYDKAEPLYQELLSLAPEILGPHHPHTLSAQLNNVGNLINLDRRSEALQRLREMEPQLLAWIGSELYSTEAERVRRQLVTSQAGFQNVVLTLALQEQSAAAKQLAGTLLLRWKLLQGEEEAYLARLARRSADSRVRDLAREIAALRSQLATLTRAGKNDEAAKALTVLEAKEFQLGQVSRDYQDYLRVRTANLEDVRAVLLPETGLLEFRQYQPIYFRTGKWGEPHWAALLLVGFEEPVLIDLGPVAETENQLLTLVRDTSLTESDQAAQALYQSLFSPLEPHLAKLKTVHLAPDGLLNLIPFSRLKLPDGRYWVQRQELRLLQTGRDLLRPDPDQSARGLLALGGIDFNAGGKDTQPQLSQLSPTETVILASTESAFLGPRGEAAWQDARNLTRETFRAGFKPLPATREEVDKIAEAYRKLRRDEPVETWSGIEANEPRLKALAKPPRVLHLSTHGFYLSAASAIDRPMLLSGVALAGANRALANAGQDGVLYSLEAQSLNLEGTELVALSACDTAQGRLDYGEGMYGLTRAFRIAGARQALVTLWPVNDGEARDFMIAFYRAWLDQDRSDPAAALHQTRLAYINHADPKLRDPRVWAPYVLIGQ